jgi:hypothetical protein
VAFLALERKNSFVNRHEKVLLILAAVLLLGAWVLCSDTTPPTGNYSEGEIPWEQLLWRLRQVIAPALALVGLASAVGVLFLRAIRWEKAPSKPVE